MSYTPTNWQNGDTITAEKLNKMESGISANDTMNEPFVVTLTPTGADLSGTMDKTGDDILQAYLSGRRIRFDVPSLSASTDAMMYNTHYDIGGDIDNVTASAFVVYDAGSGWINVLISSGVYDSNDYSTTIFPLTPMS